MYNISLIYLTKFIIIPLDPIKVEKNYQKKQMALSADKNIILNNIYNGFYKRFCNFNHLGYWAKYW
jgi:hypothetical protein